ncbi:SIR2 family NAD-dependent protein deacylase [Ornithinimicrobium cavernae]|uniref:SIR2 family NAD-dependent protein deacylase n=1 Tax=Ornithinimicrobium cavernae TaxID=2666047 RepID=UPI000D695885|nr:NAD-dependent deacylase [Ornithinimicrobium cavernae]
MPETAELPDGVVTAVRGARRVLVLTGAGMSAESGIATFRDAQTGLWETFDPGQLATPEAWAADPALVWAWYAWRIRLVRDAEPNPGHRALADLAAHREVAIVTQNIDDLHERAGSQVAAHLHGSLLDLRCAQCGAPFEGLPELPEEPVERVTPASCAGCGGDVRPGVVWFGEVLPEDAVRETEAAIGALGPGDVCLVVGTSGIVFPAAGYPSAAAAQGATVIEVNPVESELSDLCHHVVRGTAAQVLPALVTVLDEG